MTLDEKRQQKAMLLLECSESKDDLANLLEKAWRLGDAYLELGKSIKALQGVNDTGNAERGLISLCSGDIYRNGMSAVTELANDLIAARQKVREVTDRKVALGL